MDKKHTISRRQAIGGIGAVFATAAIHPVLGSSLGDTNFTPVNLAEDPTTKYPRPPFKKQSQPWPGLAGKMDPRPDHGEKSYKARDALKAERHL